MKGLTKRQQEIFNYIKSFREEHGYSPSFRELMDAFSLSSLGSIAKHIKSLEQKGFIEKDKRSWRSMAPSKKDLTIPEGISEITVIGALSKGARIEMFVTSYNMLFPIIPEGKGENYYGFTIKDTSFNEEGLTQGDLVIIETTNPPKEGDFILATQDNGATLVRNRSNYKEKDLRIYGRLVALYRLYSSSGSKSSNIGTLLPASLRTTDKTPATNI